MHTCTCIHAHMHTCTHAQCWRHQREAGSPTQQSVKSPSKNMMQTDGWAMLTLDGVGVKAVADGACSCLSGWSCCQMMTHVLVITKTGCNVAKINRFPMTTWTSSLVPGRGRHLPFCVVHWHITTKAFLTCLKVLPRITHRCARTHKKQQHAHIKAAVRPRGV